MGMDTKNGPDFESFRIRFPEDERRLDWLPRLLDSYAVTDGGLAVAVKKAADNGKGPLACTEGCDNCCIRQSDIPVYPHELIGIYWYASEKVVHPVRESLKMRLKAHEPGGECPFVIRQTCAVYPVRPAACRNFNVFGTRCAPGEDPFFTRRADVLTPIKDYMQMAEALILPFYGISGEKAREQALIDRTINSQVRNLPDIEWARLSSLMDSIDFRMNHISAKR